MPVTFPRQLQRSQARHPQVLGCRRAHQGRRGRIILCLVALGLIPTGGHHRRMIHMRGPRQHGALDRHHKEVVGIHREVTALHRPAIPRGLLATMAKAAHRLGKLLLASHLPTKAALRRTRGHLRQGHLRLTDRQETLQRIARRRLSMQNSRPESTKERSW